MTPQLSSEVELFTTQYIDNIKNDLTLQIETGVIRDLQHFLLDTRK